MITTDLTLIHDEDYDSYEAKATRAMHHIDPKDTPILAAALATNANIWSDDQHFQQQTMVPAYTTKELLALLFPQPL